jgi:hypothetical protein
MKTKFEKKTGISLDHYDPKRSEKFALFLHLVKSAGYTLDDAITFYGINALVEEGSLTIELYDKMVKGRE